jgi:hypothetical protein
MPRAPEATFDEPMIVVCVEGEVVIIGPAHVHAAFTAEAALLSADRLAAAARAAQGESDSAPHSP